MLRTLNHAVRSNLLMRSAPSGATRWLFSTLKSSIGAFLRRMQSKLFYQISRLIDRCRIKRKREEEFLVLQYPWSKINMRHGGGGSSGGGSSSSSSNSGFTTGPIIRTGRTDENSNATEDSEAVKKGNKFFWFLFCSVAAFMIYNATTAMDDEKERAKKAHKFFKKYPPKVYNLNTEEQINLQERRLGAWKMNDPDLIRANDLGVKIKGSYTVSPLPDGSLIKVSRSNGDTSFQANYPLIPVTTADYFEVTIEDKPDNAVAAVGIATKPYPAFRLPGWDQLSVGYHSDDGHKFINNNEGGEPYGPSFHAKDVVGCGIECDDEDRSRCAAYFTLNGMRLDNATNNLNHVDYGYFPTVGCFGLCTLSVNFGQTPFRYNKRRQRDRNYDSEDLI